MSKQIKQGIVFMTLFVMLFAFVRAFVIETNVDQAIQYIRRTLYTESGGQSGNVLVDIGFAGDPGSSSHGDNIRAGGDIRSSGDLLGSNNLQVQSNVGADKYCNETLGNCHSQETLSYYSGLSVGYFALAADNNGQLHQGLLYSVDDTVAVSKVKRTSAEIATVGNPMFYVEGTGFFKTLAVDPAGGGVLAAQYCDNNGTVCHSINDYYTTGQSDARYITGEVDPVWMAVSGDYYTTGQSDARYITGEVDPVWMAVSGNYFTGGYISGHFQTDIASTSCPYGFSGVADDGTVSCAVNNDTDTNFYATGLTFNTTNGDLTIQMSGTTSIIGNLDGRYITGYTETDPTVNSLGKAVLSCANAEIAKFNGTNRVCASDVDTDTHLSETTVEGYIANDISTNSIPYDNGTKLVDSPLSVSGTSIQTTNAIVVGNTSDIPVVGMIKFSGDNFYGYNSTGRQKLNN